MTRSAELRAAAVTINCYLNSEGVGVTVLGGPQGHGTIVRLPMSCDSLDETLMLIQKKLKLDERMLFASELWTPDGKLIRSFEELVAAANIDSPIIVGCGEPFDASRVPQELAEFHKQGGGRTGPKRVHQDLSRRRKDELANRAQTVRAAGHGLSAEAAQVARTQNAAQNREHVNDMRQRWFLPPTRTHQRRAPVVASSVASWLWPCTLSVGRQAPPLLACTQRG